MSRISKKKLKQEIVNDLFLKYSEELKGKSMKADAAVGTVLDEVIKMVRYHLIRGDEVSLRELCSFKPVKIKAGLRKLPNQKEKVFIPEAPKVKVVVSNKLVEQMKEEARK